MTMFRVVTRPGFRIRHASRIQLGQLTPIKLRAQTTTSTTWPAPTDLGLPDSSDPGRGILSQISTSTTYSLSDTKSNEITEIPLDARFFARAASPQPKSAIRIFWGYDANIDTKCSTGLIGHDTTWCRNPVWYWFLQINRRSTHTRKNVLHLFKDFRVISHQFMGLVTVCFVQILVDESSHRVRHISRINWNDWPEPCAVQAIFHAFLQGGQFNIRVFLRFLECWLWLRR